MGSAAGVQILGAGLLLLIHLCFIKSHKFSQFRPFKQSSDGLCATFVNQYLYHCQEFVVQTEDGFLLGVQKLTSASSDASKGPVFLYHGLFLGGDVWVLNPPSESLSFILADAGYEVWIGNTRSTTFSQGHISFTKHDQGFWDWSVDELARYDVPDMLKFVYSQSNGKILYIGFSQGTQSAFAAMTQGLLVDMVEKFVMLAPVAYVNHATTPIGVAAVKLYTDQILMALHVNYFSFRSKTGDNCCINTTRRPFYDKYELQATSTKNLYHLAQQYRSGTFSKYDYGWWGNIQRYGWINPPEYQLSQIPSNAKMMLISASKDALATPTDVQHLLSEISCNPHAMSMTNYAHLDFVVGMTANHDIYGQVLSYLQSDQ